MSFTEFFIRRPAFTLVLTLVLTIIGIISYFNLPVRWIPNITPPIVSIYTSYPGASSSLVENQITTPIETALSGIDGIETLTSNSSSGLSTITLNFKLGRNMDTVIEDVRSNLARITGLLPREAEAPIVSKANTDEMAILYLAFSDSHRSEKDLSDYVDQFIIPRLQTVEGVALVTTYGRRISAMRINLDPTKMAASNVTVDDVSRTLLDQNIQVPSGQIREKDRYYDVVTNEMLSSASQFNDLIIRHDQNQIVRLKNIGDAVVAPADMDSAFRVNGQSALALGIIPQSTANPLIVSNHVLKTFSDLTKMLPAGMKGSIVYNQANFIRGSVHSVYEAVIEAIIFVLIVIVLFLGNWRATLIPMITIPICLIATFTLLHWFKFSINTITLMAFVLSIGLVVDDAIVMLENISRHIEEGMQPFAAALKGSREIIFPIIAMTLTLASVYTPIAFTSGLLGSVFCEFALTLAGAVLVSGIIALTLSPMMCARLLTIKKQTPYQLTLTSRLLQLQLSYRKLMTMVFARKNKILLLLVVMGVIGYGLYRLLPSELAPTEDRNELMAYVSAPKDASFQYTDNVVKQVEKIYQTIPEIDSYLAGVGDGSPSNSFQVINLKPWYKRHRSAQQIADALNKQFEHIPNAFIMASVPPSPLSWFAGEQGHSISLSVMTAGDYKELHQAMENLITAAKKYPLFSYVDNHLKWDRNQFEVTIDREKAADLKVPMQTITNTISSLLAGKNVGKFEFEGKQYDILLKMMDNALANPNIIPQLYVRGDSNNMISLSDLVTVTEKTHPGVLPHNERMRADTLSSGLAPGYTIADAIKVLENLSQKILPDNMKIAFEGEARTYLESSHKMAVTFFLALLFIYLVLVAQFESFIDPFIILLTVPFAVIGALLTLELLGGSLNIYSNIGLVTLMGLIAKHGILITEFANKNLQRGMDAEEAVLEAALLRLRPILMTTCAMILGALPLALAFGPGAETRHQIGWVIVGGMLVGTFFSLIVVPIAYTYLARFKTSATSALLIKEKIDLIEI